MNSDQVFAIIKENILKILPELADKNITINDSLKELGANSIDRAEIIINSLSALQLNIPLVEMGEAKNIAELVSIIQTKLNQQ